MATNPNEILTQISELEEQVFIYASSEMDKKSFIDGLKHWVKSGGVVESKRRTLTQLLWHLTYFANTNKTKKYLYYCSRQQRTFIDNNFYKWAELNLKIIRAEQ